MCQPIKKIALCAETSRGMLTPDEVKVERKRDWGTLEDYFEVFEKSSGGPWVYLGSADDCGKVVSYTGPHSNGVKVERLVRESGLL